jgi:hypothetical protein
VRNGAREAVDLSDRDGVEAAAMRVREHAI